jgi:serine/threonine protein kinase
MKKKYIIELLIQHFEKYNSKYFTENIIIDNINYHMYFKCLLKKDLLKIYETVSNDLASKTMRKKDKLYIAKKLGEHFDINTTKYFIDVINSSYHDNIKYSTYLKCLSKKNIDKIFMNINKNINRDEQGTRVSPTAPIVPKINVTQSVKTVPIAAPSTAPSTAVGSKKKSMITSITKDKTINIAKKENIAEIPKPSLTFLSFYTQRKANKNYEENLNYIIKKYNRKRSSIIQYIIKLSQLFLNDIIVLNDINNKPIKVIIISELYKSVESLLYVGKIIEGYMIGEDVVVKIQPRLPDILLKMNINIFYQIMTEYYIMKLLNINCANAVVSKVYAYGSIGGLAEGDIGRYVLVSKLLGNDLLQLKGIRDISKIKRIFILILRALQSMHNCNLQKNISIVHLDIKPHNIVFADNNMNEIKIIDFGLSINILNANGERVMKVQKGYAGTLLYLPTMFNKKFIIDYMNDIQSFAWVLLDLLCDNNILTRGLKEKDSIQNTIYNNKIQFINNYRNMEYIKTIESGNLTPNNIAVIGEIVEYTIDRANKPNRYPTDKKFDNEIFYCDYNDAYYNDIEMILNKLSVA